jgi:ABC-type nickel/cobalt efflux system permease component RcnA
MTAGLFTAIAITGFTVAFLHAAIPTHWLPFVVAARAQHWNSAKTLVVTGIAGSGHVLFTTALGVLVAWGGIALNAKWSKAFPLMAGAALIAIGLFYLISQLKGGQAHVHLFGGHGHHAKQQHPHLSAHHHHHHESEEIEEIEHEWSRPRSDWAVIAGLVALLTFSPCEAFLPVFLTGAKYGWFGFALLSGILAIATVAGMIVFTWLTLLGLQRLRFTAMEKYEPIIIGLVFCLLGLIIILFEH